MLESILLGGGTLAGGGGAGGNYDSPCPKSFRVERPNFRSHKRKDQLGAELRVRSRRALDGGFGGLWLGSKAVAL